MCQQFRCRDLSNCNIMLHCQTQPIIESSVGLGFCCWNLGYQNLAEQQRAAKLSPFLNFWSHIHNFTPKRTQSWSYINEEVLDITQEDVLRHTMPDDMAVRPCFLSPLFALWLPLLAGIVLRLIACFHHRRALLCASQHCSFELDGCSSALCGCSCAPCGSLLALCGGSCAPCGFLFAHCGCSCAPCSSSFALCGRSCAPCA